MIRKKTIDKVKKFLQDVKNSEYNTTNSYCRANGINPSKWYPSIKKAYAADASIKELYDAITKASKVKTEVPLSDEIVESTKYVRDDKGRITGYKFNIARKVGGPLIGTLSRTQMDTLCGLYSRYGADLTAAQTSLEFPEYSLDELNRIKRAFLIFKYSCPFAPHEVDEHTEEELHNLAIERKKNNLTRTLEKNQLKDAQKINLKLAQEVEELKSWKDTLSNIKVDISGLPTGTITKIQESDTDLIKCSSLMINLSDLHIGAKLSSDCLYKNDWNEKELVRRLNVLYKRITDIQLTCKASVCYLNLLGDMLDGMDNMTARRDHIMPQNMDNKEQFNVFLKVMFWFISNLSDSFEKVFINSVPNGNHTGAPEYFAIVALKYAVDSKFKNVTMNIPDKFFTKVNVGEHLFLLCHGKDAVFMKKPLPLHLTNDSKVWLDNYLIREGIVNNYTPGHIHILKGDLHTAGFDDTLQYDYRNCLSLFGDSDYSQMNYSSNGYGVSYSVITNEGNIINGEFKNF